MVLSPSYLFALLALNISPCFSKPRSSAQLYALSMACVWHVPLRLVGHGEAGMRYQCIVSAESLAIDQNTERGHIRDI